MIMKFSNILSEGYLHKSHSLALHTPEILEGLSKAYFKSGQMTEQRRTSIHGQLFATVTSVIFNLIFEVIILPSQTAHY